MLGVRIWTGLIGGVVLVGAVWLGGLWYAGLMLAICLTGFWEYLHIRGVSPLAPPAWLGWIVLFDSYINGFHHLLQPAWFMGMLFLFLLIPVFTKNKYPLAESAYIWFGSCWLGLSLHYIAQLRLADPDGIWVFLFVMLTIWGTDTGAFFIGRWLKGPKIWPAISPGKTVSGTIGGIFFALVVGIVFSIFAPQKLHLPAFFQAGWVWGIFSILLSIAGQLGDFAESALKRAYGVKDSGRILPGHGGILDRFDSLLAAGPLAYFLLSNVLNWQ